MTAIEQSIDVGVSVRTAYDQWTQFEEFPQFIEGVEAVSQTDETHLHWIAETEASAESGTRRSRNGTPMSESRGGPPLALTTPEWSRSTTSMRRRLG